MALGFKRLGFRTHAKDEQAILNKFALPSCKTWLVSGMPLAMTQQEIHSILGNMAKQGQLILPSRRQQRYTQSWQLRADDKTVPKDDAL